MGISENLKKLNIPEDLHGLSLVKKAVKELRFQIWLRDIPSPGEVPEYIEHHQSILEIMKFTDDILYLIDREIEEQERGEINARL